MERGLIAPQPRCLLGIFVINKIKIMRPVSNITLYLRNLRIKDRGWKMENPDAQEIHWL
jgi:hypothetical protein